MSYSIGYGIQPQELRHQHKKSHFGILCTSFFLLFLIGIHLFRQDMAHTLQHMLLPGAEQTSNAIQTMIYQVAEGVPVPEAVTAFCREVISNATTP